MPDQPNQAQAAFWSGEPGQRWIRDEKGFDALLGGANALILQAAGLQPGMRVLEIGCGTGALSLDLARAVGPQGEVTAADIALPFLARARERAAAAGLANIDFLHADAQTHAFAPAQYDAIVSRFGVMFFDDPVAAFANMRRALKPAGRLAFVCWGPGAENPWFDLPRRFAIARMGQPPASDPRAPGPLAFAEPDHVRGILTDAGYSAVEVNSMALDLCPPGSAAEVAAFAAETGPANRIVQHFGGGPADITAIAEDIRREIARHETAQGVRLPGSIRLCTARNG